MAATLYALCENGGLYALPWDAGGVQQADAAWTCVADLGRAVAMISVDAEYVYGVLGDQGVGVQRLRGATPDGWVSLAPGRVRSIAAYKDELYGAGYERGGDAVFRLTRAQEHAGPIPWQRASKGRTKWIAAHAGDIYCVGNPIKGVPWVYRQSIAGLSESSCWLKCFQVPVSFTALAVLDGGVATGILDGRVAHADLNTSTSGPLSWSYELTAGLPCAALDLSFWNPVDSAFATPQSWQQSASSAISVNQCQGLRQPPRDHRPPPPPPPRPPQAAQGEYISSPSSAAGGRRMLDPSCPWQDYTPTLIPAVERDSDVVRGCELYPQWAQHGTWSGLEWLRQRDMDPQPTPVLGPLPPSVPATPPGTSYAGIGTSGNVLPSYVAPTDDSEFVWL